MVRDHVAQIVDFIWASNALKFRCDILANFFSPHRERRCIRIMLSVT